MKKLIAMLLVLTMVLALAACGGSKTTETQAPAAEAPAETQAPAASAADGEKGDASEYEEVSDEDDDE